MQTPGLIPASASRSGTGSVAITSLATTTSPAPISGICAAQALTASTTWSAVIEPLVEHHARVRAVFDRADLRALVDRARRRRAPRGRARARSAPAAPRPRSARTARPGADAEPASSAISLRLRRLVGVRAELLEQPQRLLPAADLRGVGRRPDPAAQRESVARSRARWQNSPMLPDRPFGALRQLESRPPDRRATADARSAPTRSARSRRCGRWRRRRRCPPRPG